MNARKYSIAVLVVFVTLSVSGWLIHNVLMKDLYRANAQFWRSEELIRSLLPFIHLGDFIFSLLFCFIYTKGLEGKSPAGEGFRYGLLMGLLLYLPMTIIHHVYLPYPTALSLAWLAGGVAQVTLTGTVLGLTYRK